MSLIHPSLMQGEVDESEVQVVRASITKMKRKSIYVSFVDIKHEPVDDEVQYTGIKKARRAPSTSASELKTELKMETKEEQASSSSRLTPLRNLGHVQVNCKTDDYDGNLPVDSKFEHYWKPVINVSVAYEHLPKVSRQVVGPTFPPNSLYYGVTPMPPTQAAAVHSVTNHLVKVLDVDHSNLPIVQGYIYRGLKGNSARVLLQFDDAATHQKLEENASVMKIEIEPGGRFRTWTLRGSGQRFASEVFVATLRPITSSASTNFPIKHEVACRVAEQFARSCQASASGVYQEEVDGVLGLWREASSQQWPNGSKTSSDHNKWTIALWIPKTVDRSSFVDRVKDVIEGMEFQFTFCRMEAWKQRSQKICGGMFCCGADQVDDWKRDHVDLPYK